MLSDLRESGAIEQDADIVCFIHRPEYYSREGVDAQGNDIRGMAELIVAKHRSGAVGTIKLRFIKNFAKFENYQESFSSFDAANSVPNIQQIPSRMNSEPADGGVSLTDSFAQSANSTSMPDIMPGKDEGPLPF